MGRGKGEAKHPLIKQSQWGGGEQRGEAQARINV